MGEIIYYDFKNLKINNIETIEPKEIKLDPVLEQVKKLLNLKDFEVYKSTVDDWMERNFIYEIEQLNKTDIEE